ncbi:hypothetical protein D9M69_599000 [compost metagenome]
MKGWARIFSVPNSSNRQCGVAAFGAVSAASPFFGSTAPCSTPMRKPRSPLRLNKRPFQRRPMLSAIERPVWLSSTCCAPALAFSTTTAAALRSAARPPLRFTS